MFPKLTIYEYCLGLPFLTFHVDSRKNLLYRSWHSSSIIRVLMFILQSNPTGALPLMLVNVFYSQTPPLWRKSIATSNRPLPGGKILLQIASRILPPKLIFYWGQNHPYTDIQLPQWKIDSKTLYRLMPLPSLEPDPIGRMVGDGTWNFYCHPYHDLPQLECHVAPPYAVLNAGPKCVDLNLDQVALDYYQSETSDSYVELKGQLELSRDTWALFENAQEAAKVWEEIEREERRKKKRKRDDDDMDTSSLTSKRTTRSQPHSAHDSYASQPSPSHTGSRASKGRPRGSNTYKQSTGVTIKQKRKLGSSSSEETLTESAVWHLCKRQKTTDPHTMVKYWVESTCG